MTLEIRRVYCILENRISDFDVLISKPMQYTCFFTSHRVTTAVCDKYLLRVRQQNKKTEPYNLGEHKTRATESMDTETSATSNMTQTPNNNELVPRHQLNDPTFIAYIVVMTVILAVGFVGNVLTIAVLRCREHRNKSISPLMINLAVADIIIIVFGYPVVVATLLLRLKVFSSSFSLWFALTFLTLFTLFFSFLMRRTLLCLAAFLGR